MLVTTKKCCNFDFVNRANSMTGRVKWFDTRRGYGFITGSDGVDVYVHYTAIISDGFKNLKHNWMVEFETVTLDDGKVEAREVRLLRNVAR